jgi:leucyl-tRNA synthetase
MMESRDKTGIFTGGYVINPLSGEALPVWIADYVLPGYGTGAVMGVPAHDERDFEFAHRYGLPTRVVIAASPDDPSAHQVPHQAYCEDGFLVNSGGFSGLSSHVAAQRISEWLEEHKLGKRTVQYRMRDWLISRQRYWGTPIPIVYCEHCGMLPIPDDQLPVLLPYTVDFKPDGSGRSPLARIPEFVNTTCPQCGGSAQRETDTMGGFACSSWYFLRFTSPHYDQGPYDPQEARYWMPVDLYVGGAEHAVLHLLYARFWTMVLADEGLISFREPFSRLISQGQMLAPDGQRMSKSRGNVVTPDSMVQAHGADALRLYEMFLAPFEQDVDWNPSGIAGTRRFLSRLWNLYADTYISSSGCQEVDEKLERQLHRAIRQISERIQNLRFNTMVSALMEFVGYLVDIQRGGKFYTKSYHAALDTLMILVAPAAPHIAEELWHRTGHTGSVHQQVWPVWDPELAKDELVQIPVQVNGKFRQLIEVPVDMEHEEVEKLALSHDKVQSILGAAGIAKVIYIPGKILNFVTRTE